MCGASAAAKTHFARGLLSPTAADLLQRRFATFVVQLLEPVEAIPAVAHHLAGRADVAELLGQFKQSDLRGQSFAPVSPSSPSRRKTDYDCEVKPELTQIKFRVICCCSLRQTAARSVACSYANMTLQRTALAARQLDIMNRPSHWIFPGPPNKQPHESPFRSAPKVESTAHRPLGVTQW